MPQQGDITRLLAELPHGGRDALDRVYPLIYEELRRIAHGRLQSERADHTLVTSDLVHETYLKLAGLDRLKWENRAQFFAVAARAMRRILVDYAVRRKAQKRGGERRQITLDDAAVAVDQNADELVELDRAMERLAEMNERYARVVECRYFAGLSIEETAAALGVSAATVKRDWTLARAWLHRELDA
jgi:RNA polymerase sigma factor (TIGR02999 family)